MARAGIKLRLMIFIKKKVLSYLMDVFVYIPHVSIPVLHSQNLCVEVDDVVEALFVRDGVDE